MNTKIKSLLTAVVVTATNFGIYASQIYETPIVKVDSVGCGDPWSKITVNYTLGGTDANTEYKVAFDITAGGETASVTNDAAKLTDGAATKEVNTAALFGKEVTDIKAKVKVSLIAIKPIDYSKPVQLWAGGPLFAQCNVGADTPEGYGILSNFDEAAAAVTDAMGAGWRLPTPDELKMLDGETSGYCTKIWDDTKKGYTFKGTGDYASNSIFLPVAGYDEGNDRTLAGTDGYYWSSEANLSKYAWYLNIYKGTASVSSFYRTKGLSVRAVRDAK